MARPAPGMNWLAGGAAAAILLPVLAIGLGLPFWLALVASVAAGCGAGLMLMPQRPFERLEASGVARAKLDLARELLDDAEPLLRRIEQAAASIRDAAAGDRARHLARVGRNILAAIEADPLRIDTVRRFLTYYLPRAAEMADAYGRLECSAVPDTARLAATGDLIRRLDSAFTHYLASLEVGDLGALDIELKLLKESLDADFDAGGAGPGPPPPQRPAQNTASNTSSERSA